MAEPIDLTVDPDVVVGDVGELNTLASLDVAVLDWLAGVVWLL